MPGDLERDVIESRPPAVGLIRYHLSGWPLWWRMLEATLRVSSSSTTPVGGRVDFYVAKRVSPTSPGVLGGEVAVVPPKGHRRRVTTSFDRASPLTDVAETLCGLGLGPGLRGKQVSGPVLL